MDRVAGHKSALRYLYPPIEPFDRCLLDVGDGHKLYVEQCGHPDGIPVVVLHGGPGGGCSPAMRRYFDPECYRVVLFDQRGCGMSKPSASIHANTTWHLIGDIEAIRERLDIPRWGVFGGSWGATLALLYAQKHPGRAAFLVLRGVFLMMQRELDWFYAGGAGQFHPEEWRRFADMIPVEERDDLIAAYARRLFETDITEQTYFARAWCRWENALATVAGDAAGGEAPGPYARAFARLENHYFQHHGWLDRDRQILDDMPLIAHIPGIVVQGRHDMICPPRSAWELTEAWPRGELRMIGLAGHALSEPGISEELVRATNGIARQAAQFGL
ncbi:prolyl aminopeptidase [Tropicimonas sp. IMCC6043]|uniref:prolyl aminopeptidase n=1 Tax=Tropicimonas sp. IMCC6043 TaxID=2510645 RepID=UPI00101C76B4|nr:prolyl aminopeptidase [Tropicimonas sp. IMCC6043]RYH09902.1 prolyl aminopeptidase [Tropicimonas sp. IMCC6043]